MPRKTLTRITWAIFPILLWTLGGGPAYAALAAEKQNREAAREAARQALPRDFDDVVGELGEALHGVSQGDSEALGKAKALRAEIRERDVDLRKEFADVEGMIRDKGLPDEILERHHEFVAEYERRLAAVEAGLGDVEQGTKLPDGTFERAWARTKMFFGGDPVREDAAAETLELIESYKPKRIQKSFKPEDLPFRRLTPENTPKPKETSEEWRKSLSVNEPQASILQQAAGVAADFLISQAHAQASDQPRPEDLAETIEVKFTPEIQELAAELNNNPVEIYNWVRNNIRFVPVWGSIQGADYCLQTRVCNAFDTSSLLVALLRASGIAARYQFGTIEVDDTSARNWLGGFEDLETAGTFAAGGGTPATLHTKLDGSKALRLEHVWVRAFVDYTPSLGAINKSPDAWLDLDPSYKLLTFNEGVDLSSVSATSVEQLASELITNTALDSDGALTLLALPQINTVVNDVVQDISDFLSAIPDSTTVGETLGLAYIQDRDLRVLAVTKPYDVIAKGSGHSEIPDALRHKLKFLVVDELGVGDAPEIEYEVPLVYLAGKKLTLASAPASEADRAFIESYFISDAEIQDFPTSFPSRLLSFRPELRLDDQVVASGVPLFFGEERNFALQFRAPGAPPSNVVNQINAGELIGIGLDLSRIPQAQLADRATAMSTVAADIEGYLDGLTDVNPSPDHRSDLFSAIIESWFATVDFVKEGTYQTSDIAWARYPSAGLFFADIASVPLFGMPWQALSTGFVMDVDRNLSVSEHRYGAGDILRNTTALQGLLASLLETQVPVAILSSEPFFEEPGVAYSAVEVIQQSINDGVPILSLDSGNFQALQARLVIDDGSYQDIVAAVGAGNVVIVPERPIVTADRHFSGFVIFDAETGAADYVVGQSFSGGVLTYMVKALGGVFSAMMGAFEDYRACNVRRCIPQVRQGLRSASKAVGIAATVVGLIFDLYDIYQDPKATTEQKNKAALVVLTLAFILSVLGTALATTGPLGILILGYGIGLGADAFKSWLLDQICAGCFDPLNPQARKSRRRIERIRQFVANLWHSDTRIEVSGRPLEVA